MSEPEALIKLQKDLEYTAECRFVWRGETAPLSRESSRSCTCEAISGRIVSVWPDENSGSVQKIAATVKSAAETMGYVV